MNGDTKKINEYIPKTIFSGIPTTKILSCGTNLIIIPNTIFVNKKTKITGKAIFTAAR